MTELHYKGRKVLVFPGPDEAAAYIARKWAALGKAALARKGRFDAAVSGGRTPVPLFRRLAESAYPPGWEKTHLFFADERHVPRENPDSNYGMLDNVLLRRISIPPGNIHGIPYAKTPKASAEAYARELKRFFKLKAGDFPRFDLLLLGLGEDGHTASLFPGSRALSLSKSFAAPVRKRRGRARVTLTLPVINSAATVIFLVTGAGKAGIVRGVLKGGPSLPPAALVRPRPGGTFFVLDRKAASLL